MTFSPRLDVLPAPQHALWSELAAVPQRFILYGGTAIALRLAHRPSVDFDFFTHDPLDHHELEAVEWVRAGETIQEGPNERSVLVHRGGPIKVSFFGGIAIGRVGEPERTDDGVLRVASLLDLAGTKIKALLQRIEAKDYRDVAALLDHLSLEEILGAASALFGPAFNHLVAQKALAYFVGGDLDSLDDVIRTRLLDAAARDLLVPAVSRRSPRLD